VPVAEAEDAVLDEWAALHDAVLGYSYPKPTLHWAGDGMSYSFDDVPSQPGTYLYRRPVPESMSRSQKVSDKSSVRTFRAALLPEKSASMRPRSRKCAR
jgi:hypothetical protein